MDPPALSNSPPMIRLEGISKRFGELWANREISLDLFEGEIHAIVGENGAGKSTLMKILFGHFKPDSGSMTLHGKPLVFSSPREAIKTGFGMVHQQLLIFPQLSALENVLVGFEPNVMDGKRRKSDRDRVAKLCTLFGFDLSLDTLAENLPFAHRQQIELLRVLHRQGRVLILDEPTSLLSPSEVDRLLDLLKSLKAIGHTILFVSHRLQEVFAIADLISIFHRGRCQRTLLTSQTTPEEVAHLIVQGAVNSLWETSPMKARKSPEEFAPMPVSSAPLVHLQRITSSPSGHEPGLEDFSLPIYGGEILGIGGIVGNGQRSLAHVLVGMKKPERGVVLFDGKEITHSSVAERRKIGFCWLPANPLEEGLLPTRSIWENSLLGRQRQRAFSFRGWLRQRPILRYIQQLLDAGEVAYPALNESVVTLSGGNQQKMVLVRELSSSPRFAVLEQPARGLDIRAQDQLRRRVGAMKDSGVTFLLVSHDLDELLAIADRIGIIYRGSLMGVVDKENASREILGKWMLGLPA